MSKSIVLRFFAWLYQFVNCAFSGSILKKIQDFFADKLKKSSKHSFFVKYFTKAPLVKEKTKESFVCKVLLKICSFFALIVNFFAKYFEKSLIVTSLVWLYENVFKISVRCYGVFLLSFSIVLEIVLLLKSQSVILPVILLHHAMLHVLL